MALSHPLPENHENKLRTILGLGPGDLLPAEVEETYDAVRRTARKLHFHMDDRELILVSMLAGRPTPEPPASFFDQVNKLDHGAKVLAKYRGKMRFATYKGYDRHAKQVLVDVDDYPGEIRRLKITSVRMPTKEELNLVGELPSQQTVCV